MEGGRQWLMFPSPMDDVSLDEFLAAYPPSRVSQSRVQWIYVASAHPQHVRSQQQSAQRRDPHGLQCAWRDLCERIDLQPSAAHIHAFAQRFHVLSGKWMVFCRRQEVDDMWRRVAEAVVSGALGISAKVSPAAPDAQRTHLICVYVNDYTNREDVFRVRETLRRMGVTKRLSFKADAYTHLRIYHGNEWGIHESIFAD
ncbi:hypothetical protein FI667_g12316, partial [Globisporangium splendens]